MFKQKNNFLDIITFDSPKKILLNLKDGIECRKIEKEINLGPYGLIEYIHKFLELGLITRKYNGSNKRTKYIYLTKKGKELQNMFLEMNNILKQNMEENKDGII